MEKQLLFTWNIPASLREALVGGEVLVRRAPNGAAYVSPEVRDLIESGEVQYLSTRQVPSCLRLKGGGHSDTRRNRITLREAGFPLLTRTSKGDQWLPDDEPVQPWTDSRIRAEQLASLSDILSRNEEFNAELSRKLAGLDDQFSEENPVVTDDKGSSAGEDSEFSESNPVWEPAIPGRADYRLQYSDPFLVQAAYLWSGEQGTPIQVRVDFGDCRRLQDPIPYSILKAGGDWEARSRKGVPFHNIASLRTRIHVLKHHTHWGSLLWRWSADRTCEEYTFARRLTRKIKRFLAGGQNPDIPVATREYTRAWERGEIPARQKSRTTRLLQVLVTIDGLFCQRYLANPYELWTWDRFDRFVLATLHALLPEEFVDGDISKEHLERITSVYAELKAARQDFKAAAMRDRVESLVEETRQGGNTLRKYLFLRSWEDYLQLPRERRELRAQTLGILSQTRGCGTPPKLVVIGSKVKFLETVSQAPPPVEPGVKAIWKASFEKILGDAPDDAFTGLQTKVGVRVTSASCWERTRADGGTADAINQIAHEGALGRTCKTYDLDTGELVGEKPLNECTPGEYIFWRALEEVLATDLEDLRRAYLLMVNEPGKARAVTKAMATLKVVLDLVNGWVSYPLGKAFPSSASGMLKESHGWNFFKTLCADEEVVFRTHQVVDAAPAVGYKIREVLYHQVFVSSTDYKTATDNLLHELAEHVGDGWMRKCGVPPVLRGIVIATCYRPRTVYFEGRGSALEGIGQPAPEYGETTRKVRLVRGVLMGDPLTKVVLHLINMMVRAAAVLLVKGGDRRVPHVGLGQHGTRTDA